MRERIVEEMSSIREAASVELQDLVLVPHFVVKTKIFTPYKTYPSGTKLFINVCTNDKVPTKDIHDKHGKPIVGFEPQLIFVAISNGEWEIPILTSPELRDTVDKKKNKAIVVDCVINDKYMKWCMLNEDLKDILIQWCIDAIEFHVGDNFVVDRDSITFPRRSCMGGEPPNIQVDLQHLRNISKELEELSRDMYEEKDTPTAILNAQRLDQLVEEERNIHAGSGDELPPLLPQQSKGKLIVELDEELPTQTKAVESKSSPDAIGLSEVKSTRAAAKNAIGRKKIQFEVNFSKLEPKTTNMDHKYELVIKSKLKSAAEYQVKYLETEKELLISSTENADDCITFPLPLDVSGSDITSFYVQKDGALHVFVL